MNKHTQSIKPNTLWRPTGTGNYRVVVECVKDNKVTYRDSKDPNQKWARDISLFQERYRPEEAT